MLFSCCIFLQLIILQLTIAKHHDVAITDHNTIISISSILGTQLIFNVDTFNELRDGNSSKTISWYKGITNLKPLISNSVSIQSRYKLINQTKLIIEQTLIGDEGFYTLKIQTDINISKHYLYHVILFTQNLSLSIYPHSTYHAEQQINFTCSINLHADRIYMEQSRSIFLSTWYMIIYNNDPDSYELLSLSSNSYLYKAYILNYELNRNDHNQTVSCMLIQQELQQIVMLNFTRKDLLNIEYKAYLRGNYYFIRSFNAYSSIEINCEEFDANPKAVYTLIWILNERNQTLLNKTHHGRYLIDNATWQNRGIYICYAENYLNNNQPVHQSFRLNIWFHEHQKLISSSQLKLFSLTKLTQSNRNQSMILIIFIIIFFLACLFFVLSLYYFCLQYK
ncbi:unnamed protein product [Adineta steineri]|uniref:Ig-like domain-containing protein n=1 Tax=Adineta steineri TaxID=433720 RepID=A0A814LZX0_9BILA|nr:unnamed protein product [Adineta steineri]CAF3534035.1 unnamed protein product [Adineta steineri]